jgi:hypothetical protein
MSISAARHRLSESRSFRATGITETGPSLELITLCPLFTYKMSRNHMLLTRAARRDIFRMDNLAGGGARASANGAIWSGVHFRSWSVLTPPI